MTLQLLWIIPALALAPCAWFVATRLQQRKINVLLAQIKTLKQTAAEHANQARNQVAQLQSELAARPPMSAAVREQRASAAAAAASTVESRRALAEQLLADDGFKATTIVPNHGFARTEVMEG